jgi:hypothetical protein
MEKGKTLFCAKIDIVVTEPPPPPEKAEVRLPRPYRVVLDEARTLQTQHQAYDTMIFKL